MTLRTLGWTTVLFAAPLLAACSSTAPSAAPPPPPAQAAPEAPLSDLEALYWARLDSARALFNDADVAFMTGMIGHHAQALIMSRLAPENGASPAVQRLAARIINAQHDEIAAMQRWLRDRGQPVPEFTVDGLALHIELVPPPGEQMNHEGMNHEGMDHEGMDHEGMDHEGMSHGGHDHAGMPGMLTDAQLHELAAARGAAFDRLFLRYMIQHHSGAITMVGDLFEAGGATRDEAAFKLASDINVDQLTEIARMQRMLDALPPSQD